MHYLSIAALCITAVLGTVNVEDSMATLREMSELDAFNREDVLNCRESTLQTRRIRGQVESINSLCAQAGANIAPMSDIMDGLGLAVYQVYKDSVVSHLALIEKAKLIATGLHEVKVIPAEHYSEIEAIMTRLEESERIYLEELDNIKDLLEVDTDRK